MKVFTDVLATMTKSSQTFYSVTKKTKRGAVFVSLFAPFINMIT